MASTKQTKNFIHNIGRCTPTPGIEPGGPKGTGLKPVALPLCDVGIYDFI